MLRKKIGTKLASTTLDFDFSVVASGFSLFDLGTIIRWIFYTRNGFLEQMTLNHRVPGSSPGAPTIDKQGFFSPSR
jgi:hypothetical protein